MPVGHTAAPRCRGDSLDMLARNAAVLAALAVGTGHFLAEIWFDDLGGTTSTDKASATIVALTLAALAALAWRQLPLVRPVVMPVGIGALTSAWTAVAEADALAAGAGAVAYLAAANVLLAAGVVELAGALGIRVLTHPARA
jgi:hypothetical protein